MHILPRRWESHWPLADDTDEGRDRRERLLHSIGNLTLVTQEFNTSLSNRAFQRKQNPSAALHGCNSPHPAHQRRRKDGPFESEGYAKIPNRTHFAIMGIPSDVGGAALR